MVMVNLFESTSVCSEIMHLSTYSVASDPKCIGFVVQLGEIVDCLGHNAYQIFACGREFQFPKLLNVNTQLVIIHVACSMTEFCRGDVKLREIWLEIFLCDPQACQS